MTIRGVLFDLDGTLVDSLPDISSAMNETLEELGLPSHPREAYRRFVGEGVGRLVAQVLPPGAPDQAAAVEVGFRVRYEARLTERSRPYPGVPELLAGLTAGELVLAVCSNKPHLMTERVVAELFAGAPFAGVEGQRDERPRKPDPAAALDLARALELPPAELAFVGDTLVDMQTGANAGMVPLGVTWGFRDREELLEHGAAAVFDTPQELLAWLLERAPS